MGCNPPGSSVLGILQAKILEQVSHSIPYSTFAPPICLARRTLLLLSPVNLNVSFSYLLLHHLQKIILSSLLFLSTDKFREEVESATPSDCVLWDDEALAYQPLLVLPSQKYNCE